MNSPEIQKAIAYNDEEIFVKVGTTDMPPIHMLINKGRSDQDQCTILAGRPMMVKRKFVELLRAHGKHSIIIIQDTSV